MSCVCVVYYVDKTFETVIVTLLALIIRIDGDFNYNQTRGLIKNVEPLGFRWDVHFGLCHMLCRCDSRYEGRNYKVVKALSP